MSIFMKLLIIVSLLSLSACNKQEMTKSEEEFGSSVRNMIKSQIYDQSTVDYPSTATHSSQDGKKSEQVMGTYRNSVSKKQEVNNDIQINVGQ